MSSSNANLFRDISNQIRDVVDLYMVENSSENATGFAGMIQLAKANLQVSISTLPEQHQANFFNEAIARVVLQKVADLPSHASNERDALLKLTLTMLYGTEILKPTDWMNLGVFLDEATARLVGVRTKIVDWIREPGQVIDENTRRDFRVYENLALFMAGLYTALQKSEAWQLVEDLRAAGLLGMHLISDTVRVDKMNYIGSEMRGILFFVALTWLADSDGFFVKELVRLDNLQEIANWRVRFHNFFYSREWVRQWGMQSANFKHKIGREFGRFTQALKGINST